MADTRLQQIADSALLKVLQFAVTTIMVPAAAWFGGNLMDRLAKIEAALAAANTDKATFELRLQSLERGAEARQSSLVLLNEKVVRQEYEIRALKENQ